jgi:hypothetical protein
MGDDDKVPVERLSKHATHWMRLMREQTKGMLEQQIKFLDAWHEGEIINDIQEVTKTLVGIWYDGVDKILGRK